MARAFDNALGEGLSLDQECFDATLNGAVVHECPQWPWLADEWPCTSLVGNQSEGEACQTYFELSPFVANDCQMGLLCYAGTCEREPYPLSPQALGANCQKDVGCGSLGLYCGEDGQCHTKVSLGQACEHYLACDPGTYCAGLGEGKVGECSTRANPGAACNPKDWASCGTAEEGVYSWCPAQESTCVPGQPGICRVTHPAAAIP